MNILSCDFDYFAVDRQGDPNISFREQCLYDWSHKETPMFIHMLWDLRAAGFMRAGLPLPVLSGEERFFWDQFKIKKGATLYYAESHSQAAHLEVTKGWKPGGVVYNYDAHHDCGYSNDGVVRVMREGRIECGEWMVWYHLMGGELHVRYPQWKKWAFDDEPPMSVCLSSIAPHKKGQEPVDRQFHYGEAPDITFDRVFVCRSGAWVPTWHDAAFFDFIERAPVAHKVNLDNVAPRKWDEHAVRAMAEQMEAAVKEMAESEKG